MPPAYGWIVLAGLISGAIFTIVALMGLGFFFLFLPTLPLFWFGLSQSPRVALLAGIVASLTGGVLLDPPTGLFFFLLLALPTWHICRMVLLSQGVHTERIWFPIGLALTQLTFYACGLVAVLTLYHATTDMGLADTLAAQIREAFNHMGEEYSEVIELLAGKWSFLMFSMGIWLWTLALYVHGWFINRMLVKRGKQIRPHFRIDVFPMPYAALAALVLSAIASMGGSGDLGFLGKALVVGLLLPYFLLGAAHMHKYSAGWPNRGFFLFFVYAMVVTQFWPALILSAFGVFAHIKRLSDGVSSTKD